MICPFCLRNFPSQLLSEMAIGGEDGLRYELKCPLCALAYRNAMHGLRPDTPFNGKKAARIHREAVRHLKETEQAK